ncbi:MAG: hypothetical protein NTZ39_09955 [Methanoregula sp.]|nr:hypothetical protein [Methanoregula sp.]
MNTHYKNIAGPAAKPGTPGTAARANPGIRLARYVEWFSGIRSSGQYCRPTELTRTDSPVTAFRITRGRSAVHGMRP